MKITKQGSDRDSQQKSALFIVLFATILLMLSACGAESVAEDDSEENFAASERIGTTSSPAGEAALVERQLPDGGKVVFARQKSAGFLYDSI